MTIEQIEKAYTVWSDLQTAVGHFVHGLDMILVGELEEAAWSFYRAGMTKTEPAAPSWWDL